MSKPIRESEAKTSTREMLDAHLRGHSDATRRLFVRIAGALRDRLAAHPLMRPLRGRVESDDVVQEVLLRLVAGGVLGRVTTHVAGDLLRVLDRVLEHTLIDLGRRIAASKRQPNGTVGMLDGVDAIACRHAAKARKQETTPTGRVRAADLREYFASKLQGRDLEIWQLVDVAGESAEDVAARLGMTSAAVRGVLSRVRARLARLIP